mmetsp:Transcript_27977/g.56335  ORF Transcript_27977/g.56335 Transcript_27977/m.56335 type:complete len:299 (-) Transcript_27977:449-1345(-)
MLQHPLWPVHRKGRTLYRPILTSILTDACVMWYPHLHVLCYIQSRRLAASAAACHCSSAVLFDAFTLMDPDVLSSARSRASPAPQGGAGVGSNRSQQDAEKWSGILQKVVGHPLRAVGHLAEVLRPRFEDGVVDCACLVDVEDCGDVAASVAIVWCGPDRHEQLPEIVLVTFHGQLVRPRDHFELVCVEELVGNVRAEDVARAALRDTPPLDVVIGVRPHQVAHGPLVRRLLHTHQVLDLVDCVERGRQAAVHAEHHVVDDRTQAEHVEDVDAPLPHRRRTVLFEALVVEAVNLGDLP